MRPVTLNPPYLIGDFDALLATRQLAPVECFTLRLLNGDVLTYTTGQVNLTVPPCDQSEVLTTYVANDVLITGLKFKITSGQTSTPGDPSVQILVDEQTVTFTPNQNPAAPTLIDGTPFLEAVMAGALDEAVIQRDRWFLNVAGGAGVGGMPMFYGFTASINKLTGFNVEMKVKADPVLLNIMMPRNLYQPNCQYTVYSTGCGVNKAANTTHTSVGAGGGGPTRTFIPWAGVTAQFTNGDVFFENGANVNVAATIKSVNAGVGFNLAYPLKVAPLVGDLIAVAPGCDRQFSGGCTFFSNTARFRATPFVPPPEYAI